MKNKNLVLGAAINYDWKILKPFVESFRKYSNDRIILLVKNDIDRKFISKLKSLKIELFFVNYAKYKILKKPGLSIGSVDTNQLRYKIYIDVINKLKIRPKKILLTDVRDVIFQSNIFKHNWSSKINFFLEEQLIKNCPMNSRWLINTVGKKEYDKIKDNFISCSGTTLANYKEMLKYVKLMSKIIEDFPYKRPLRHIIIRKKVKPYDQGPHNYIIYNNFFKNQKKHKNETSKIATISFMKNIYLNKNRKLINKKKELYSVIHQYDRLDKKYKLKIL